MHNPKTFSDYASYEPYPLDYNAEAALNDYGMMDEVRNNEEFRRYQDYLDYLQGSIYQETESGTGNLDFKRATNVNIVKLKKIL